MTVSESTRNKILALAWWYEGKPYNPYLAPRADQPALPDEIIDELSQQRLRYSLLAFKEIYNARRVGVASPNGSSSESSDQPSEPKRKRQAVVAELPNALKRHWDILRICNRSDDEALFVRVKVRALRVLATTPQGIMKLPDRVNAYLFSFLKAQDLCALSGCSTEWNYQTQNVPKIWEKLGREFGLPDDYWPSGDYSKPRCVRNLDYIDFANQELRRYTEVGSPLVRTIGKWSGRSAVQLRSDLADPQERFTKHTLPIMKALLAHSASSHFRELFSRGDRLDDPRGLVNLFWTCGYPKQRFVFDLVIEQFAKLRIRPEFTKELAVAWLDTVEWVVNHTPQWAYDAHEERRHPIRVLDKLSQNIPVDEHKRVLELLLKLMQKGGVGRSDLRSFFGLLFAPFAP